jgi:hypothetical protein
MAGNRNEGTLEELHHVSVAIRPVWYGVSKGRLQAAFPKGGHPSVCLHLRMAATEMAMHAAVSGVVVYKA